MIYFHQIERPNPYAAATHRFERKIIETDFRRFWDLRDIMTALPHIQFKDGYTLDAYYVGDRRNARMKLYAYLMDSTEDYNPGPVGVHQNPDNMLKGIHWIGEGKREDDKIPEPTPFMDGQVINGTISFAASKTVPPLEDYLDIDFTGEAIWEAMLLIEESASYLPHRWHGGYSNGRLIVDQNGLMHSCLNRLKRAVWEPFLQDARLIPTVEMISEKEAMVHYCRWNDWGGLSSINILATRVNRSLRFDREKPVKLIDYDCGLRF